MKKIISILVMLCILTTSAASAADMNKPLKFEKATELEPLTPLGGTRLEAGEFKDSGLVSISLMSQGNTSLTFEEYLREQLVNHAATINISQFGIPESEFFDRFFTFIFSNSDLPILAAYNNATTYIRNGVVCVHSFSPFYVYPTKEECDRKYMELDALTTSLAEHASKGKTDAEKALFLFDKISLDYSYTPGNTFEDITRTPYSFLDNGHGICQGFAILYKLALDKLGIESYVCSNLHKSVNHSWNYIKIEGNWYHADPTWSFFADADDLVLRKYFLLSDSAMINDALHGNKADWLEWSADYSVIDCTSDEFSDDYLFRNFHDPIYRDEASLYFSTSINGELDLTLRNDSLKSPVALISEPDNSQDVYLITLKNYNKESNIIMASYGENESFLGCSTLSVDPLNEYTIKQFPAYTPAENATKLKWMLISKDDYSPVAYYSETTINK